MFSWFKRADKVEKRSAASGFTAEIIQAREAYISGRRGIAELTATVQSCVSLWEQELTLADVDGIDMLDRRSLALPGRSLALRGEAVFLIDQDGLAPCSDWDLRRGRAALVLDAQRRQTEAAEGGDAHRRCGVIAARKRTAAGGDWRPKSA